MIKLKRATNADLVRFWGHGSPYSVKAFVLLEEEVPVAVGGIAYEGEWVTFFMEWKEEALKYPIALVKAGKAAIELARRDGHHLLYAVAKGEDRKRAKRYMEHFGLTLVSENSEGALYKWLG